MATISSQANTQNKCSMIEESVPGRFRSTVRETAVLFTSYWDKLLFAFLPFGPSSFLWNPQMVTSELRILLYNEST